MRAYLSAAFTFGIQWDNDAKRHFEALRFGILSNPVRDVPKAEKACDQLLAFYAVDLPAFEAGEIPQAIIRFSVELYAKSTP